VEQYEDMPVTISEAFKTNSLAVLTTGCALLVASFIQGARGALGAYDALIVLQLSWMNTLTAAVPALYLLAVNGGRTSFALYCLHCSLTGIFGICLFNNIEAWSPGCAENYFLVLCGQVLQSSGAQLRAIVLVLSAIAAVPVLNGFYIFVVILILNPCRTVVSAYMPLLVWVTLDIILTTATEQFISHNSGMVVGASDQSEWGFGQVVAILLLVPPVWASSCQLFTVITLWRSRREKRMHRQDLRAAEATNPSESAIMARAANAHQEMIPLTHDVV